jgi:hypothetical protein
LFAILTKQELNARGAGLLKADVQNGLFQKQALFVLPRTIAHEHLPILERKRAF